jgi:nuclear protein localization family protein 4
MLLRVRSNVGVWRVDGLEVSSTVEDVLKGIATIRPHVTYEKPLCHDPACKQELEKEKTLEGLNLRHGSMVHCRVDPATCADVSATPKDTDEELSAAADTTVKPGTNMKRIIDKDGSIKLVPTNEVRGAKDDKGFRRGMMPLRDIKMAWTLNEFVAMNSQFEFKVQRQESAICKQVSLDSASVGEFQSYLRRFQFSRKRFGILYGKFVDSSSEGEEGEEVNGEKKAIVEAIYEPPQIANPDVAEGFEMLEDPMEDTVEEIAQMCGLEKVGWIFGHPPREDGFVLSSSEVIMAAEMQLEAAGGVEDTPYVTVKVTTGEDGNVSVEAFQVSKQCMAMAAEEALEIGPDPGFCNINETFTAIQEGKESKTVNNNFFLTVVPIVQHNSQVFVSQFPKANRDLDDRTPSHDELKRQLSKSGTAGWSFIDLLSDFNLLIYLSKFLDVNADFPKICQSISDRNIPLDDGYKIIITSMAGVDGAY